MGQGFMRTILSALSYTKANLKSNFNTLEEKQRHITSLIQRGGLGVNALKVNGQGAPILDFVKNRKALNKVLLSQLLQKKIGITNSDLVTIQDVCHWVRKMKEKVLNQQTTKFSLSEKILYKDELVLGTQIHKLVIPAEFTHQILYNNHYTQNRHMFAQSHFESFSSNFYTKSCKNIALRVVKSCVICELNRAPYNQKTSGT